VRVIVACVGKKSQSQTASPFTVSECTRTCAGTAEARGLDASLRHVFAFPDTTEVKGTNER